ncbi:MAG: hypothetical protein ACK4UJ_08205 [Leptonema sp. (in: bacteria)]
MKNKNIVFIYLIVILAILVFFVWIYNKKTTKKEESLRKKVPFEFFEDKPQFLTPEQIEQILNEHGAADEVINQIYKDYLRFPPDSRPLDKKMVDLLNPWKIPTSPLPVILNPNLKTETSFKDFLKKLKEEGKTEEQIQEIIEKEFKDYPSFVFQTNKHTLTLGDTLIATLKITDPKGNLLNYEVLEAGIYADRHFDNQRLATPEYNDSGIEPDDKKNGIYTFSWKIPSSEKKYWGDLSLKVKVRIDKLANPNEIELEQGFYSSPFTIAEFLDQFEEEFKDGHLYITAFLDVKKECEYHIQANLISLDFDEPTHWVYYKGILKPGIQKINFRFWGKIFKEKGVEGYFELRDLRGYCENLPFPPSWFGDPSKVDAIVNAKPKDEPLYFYLPFTNLSYKTKRYYKLTEFSDQEWNQE